MEREDAGDTSDGISRTLLIDGKNSQVATSARSGTSGSEDRIIDPEHETRSESVSRTTSKNSRVTARLHHDMREGAIDAGGKEPKDIIGASKNVPNAAEIGDLYKQLILPFTWAFSKKPSDLVVCDGNRYAFEWIEKWPFKVRNNFVCLVGESGSGKSHLANLWAARVRACVIDSTSDVYEVWHRLVARDIENQYFVLDDADKIVDEVLLFYLYNTILEMDAYLLLTAKTAPSLWGLKLPDLKSRIATINVVNIKKPNDDAFAEIMGKMLRQRGILASPECIKYILDRIDRSYASMNYWVKCIDTKLGHDKKMTIARVREMLSA